MNGSCPASPEDPAVSQRSEDPVLTSARREALTVLATWLIAMTYSLLYCARHAYGRPVEEIRFLFGFPDWVFWGVIVPWVACLVFSWFFAAILMRDEDLGEDPPGAEFLEEPGREP
jgi:Protein of unknown function (DUF997)